MKAMTKATKGASAPASSTSTTAAPSPEMLRAVFDTLHQLGWKSGNNMTIGIDHRRPMPPADGKKPKPPTTAQINAVFTLTRELGWMFLNDEERGLILQLRRTTYHGRKVVNEVANAISRDFPWVDGSPYNTQQ